MNRFLISIFIPSFKLLSNYSPFISIFFMAIYKLKLIIFIPIIKIEIRIQTVSISKINCYLPVSALFFITIGDIKYFYHFCSNLAPLLYLTFFSQISESIVLELSPQASLSHFSFLNIL